VIAALIVVHLLLGAGLVASGDRVGRRAFAIGCAAPLATVVWWVANIGTIVDGGEGDAIAQRIEWVPSLGLALDLRVDAFAAVMLALISIIGVAVCVYAVAYFGPDKPGLGRLGGLLIIFAGAMTGVVVSDHLLALFVFWELTSVTSYLLIGNDDRNPRARDAATSAILITGAGGLAMLAGLILLGQAAGTYRLSELAGAFDSSADAAVGIGSVILILLGAFTKSAQWPFSGWLPGAMVAPTPISTYLHAATMVKAGVFLVARLAPVMYTVDGWRPIVFVTGAVTMFFGGWRALRQVDLKVLLAHGTVSQLGFMMMLAGAGTYSLTQALVVVLLAHGAFKAALFMVVGIVDHQLHTRDIRRITGTDRRWWPVYATAIIGAASMAGLPPLLGFIAKEKALLYTAEGYFGGNGVVAGAIVAGSVLTFAYSARFVLGVFGRQAEPATADDEHPMVQITTVAPPSARFVAPGVVLAGFSLVAGVAPVIVDDLVHAATVALHPGSHPSAVKLWAGFNVAVWLSVAVIAAGSVLVAVRHRVESAQDVLHRPIASLPTADRSFWALVTGALTGAKRVTRVLQNGSLPVYLAVILSVVAIGPTVVVVGAVGGFDVVDGPDVFVDSWVNVVVYAVIIAAALAAAAFRRRIAAVLMLGAVGYAMAGFYVLRGAPDLALTQFAIETLATVLFVLVMRALPPYFRAERTAISAPFRLLISAAVGIGVFVFALAATGARDEVASDSISAEMLERSIPDGKGSNVVNVILVDFRGLDTLGEITVLVVAALGVVALTRVARRGAATPNRMAESPVVNASARLLFTSITVLSLYFLFAGHNQPGGGFVGGLTAAAGLSLLYVAGGRQRLAALLPVRPWIVLGVGLAISVVTAIVPMLLGGEVLEHALWSLDIPILGKVKTTSALPFDVGVYLVVVGLVLMAYEAFGDDPDDVSERLAAGSTL
jgi:multicomponent Na+:H+ antiporter subunit A